MNKLLLIGLSALSLTGCLTKGTRTSSVVLTTGDGKAHHIEPVALNRFPMPSVMKNTVVGQPEVEVVQEQNGVKYGLRPFSNEAKVRELIKPGDVAIYYNLLTKSSTPMNIAQWGMYHSATVVLNRPFPDAAKKIDETKPDDTLCFVHAGQGADCNIFEFTHFFRINYDDAEIPNKVAEMAGRTIGTVQYDATFTTEILNNNNTLDKRTLAAVQEGNIPPQYCSELPYTLHSTMKSMPLFPGKFMSGFISEYKEIRKLGQFTCPMDTDASVASLMKYLGQFDLNLNKSQKALLNTIVKQYLKDRSTNIFANAIHSTALAGIDRITGHKVMPSDFVKAFHEGNAHISYIGSWEANAVPKEDQCGAEDQAE